MIKGEGETPKNRVRLMRESMLMSKAELARKAGLSALTIDRVEKGNLCRVDTKRKILLALGVKLSERNKVFLEEEPADDVSSEHELEYVQESSTSSHVDIRRAETPVSNTFNSDAGKTRN